MSEDYTPEPPLIWDIEEIDLADVEAFEELEELLKEENDDIQI
jgi:hypothetical protein